MGNLDFIICRFVEINWHPWFSITTSYTKFTVFLKIQGTLHHLVRFAQQFATSPFHIILLCDQVLLRIQHIHFTRQKAMIPRVQVVSLIQILVWYSSANIEEKKQKKTHAHTHTHKEVLTFMCFLKITDLCPLSWIMPLAAASSINFFSSSWSPPGPAILKGAFILERLFFSTVPL